MTKREDIYSMLSKKYNVDKRLVESICSYPFLFIRKRIMDPRDETGIMLQYFGKIRMKKKFKGKKMDVFNKLVEHEKQKYGYSNNEHRHNV